MIHVKCSNAKVLFECINNKKLTPRKWQIKNSNSWLKPQETSVKSEKITKEPQHINESRLKYLNMKLHKTIE